MESFRVTVSGPPPAKSEAKSLLAHNHPHLDRSRALLEAVRGVLGEGAPVPFPDESLGLELVVVCASEPPSDATNYLGGVADVLQVKSGWGDLTHLQGLGEVAVFGNDRRLHEVSYRWEVPGPGDDASRSFYTVRVWRRRQSVEGGPARLPRN